MKYHQNESLKLNFDISKYCNIIDLNDEILRKNKLDLYQILPETSMLITDYSSVYIDYLLVDKPILFTSQDLDIYSQSRGVLLEPYEFWTPGNKPNNQEELEYFIKYNIETDNNKSKRNEIKSIFFTEKKNPLIELEKLIKTITSD